MELPEVKLTMIHLTAKKNAYKIDNLDEIVDYFNKNLDDMLRIPHYDALVMSNTGISFSRRYTPIKVTMTKILLIKLICSDNIDNCFDFKHNGEYLINYDMSVHWLQSNLQNIEKQIKSYNIKFEDYL